VIAFFVLAFGATGKELLALIARAASLGRP
jgi:hypothetical protein